MFNDLINQFMGSQHANDAMAALQQQQGMSPDQARDAVNAAAQATQQHAQSGDPAAMAQQFGTFGNAAVGGIGGMLGGGGVRGAVEGGIGSVIAGKAAQVIAERTGMNPNTASSVAAVAMPFLMRFVQQHMGAQNAQNAQNPQGGQAMPAGKPAMAPGAKDGAGADGGAFGGGDAPPWKRGL